MKKMPKPSAPSAILCLWPQKTEQHGNAKKSDGYFHDFPESYACFRFHMPPICWVCCQGLKLQGNFIPKQQKIKGRKPLTGSFISDIINRVGVHCKVNNPPFSFF